MAWRVVRAESARISYACALVLVFFILMPSFSAMAQSPSPSPAASSQQLLKAEELDALVAPIALYPDTLLPGS
jgi:hypothetical protein